MLNVSGTNFLTNEMRIHRTEDLFRTIAATLEFYSKLLAPSQHYIHTHNNVHLRVLHNRGENGNTGKKERKKHFLQNKIYVIRFSGDGGLSSTIESDKEITLTRNVITSSCSGKWSMLSFNGTTARYFHLHSSTKNSLDAFHISLEKYLVQLCILLYIVLFLRPIISLKTVLNTTNLS